MQLNQNSTQIIVPPNVEEINSSINLTAQTAFQNVKALQEKMNIIVEEYHELIENNRKLKDEIEIHEKIKKLLLNPQLFPLEMQKYQFIIETYSRSLAELDKEAEKTLSVLNL